MRVGWSQRPAEVVRGSGPRASSGREGRARTGGRGALCRAVGTLNVKSAFASVGISSETRQLE